MKVTLNALSFAALCCLCLGVHAATEPVRGAGDVTAVDVAGQVLHLHAEHADIALSVYSPAVIRVRIDRHALGRDFSYGVTAKPASAPLNVTQNDAEVVLKTAQLTARVTRHPFSLAFYTADGKLLNRDEPGLGTSWIGEEVTSYKSLQDGERFIGLGEKTGPLDRRGLAYTNWNTDAFRYGADTDPLYSTIPFYIGVHHGLSYGIFLDNSYQSDFNFGASNRRFSSFSAQGGEMNYYFIYQPRVADIIGAYTALTGRMPLPPLWSLGYQQNRYSYYPEAEVMRIAHTLREKRIPADGITLDIHFMDGYRLFTWDKTRFPDPAGMMARLAALGFKTTVIVDPGVKAEPGYAVYDSGVQADVFVRYPDGSNYTAEVWPGWCNFPDFTSERGRAWWRREVQTYARAGVSGLWNDMNEFSTWGQRTPANVLFDFDGERTTHKQARNVYGLEMVRSSYEGMREANGQRPFILSRSGYAGLQRYSAIWTGDNQAEDYHMLLGVRMLNSLGLAGVAFTGMDVGGFLGAPTPALYARWMQVGAFTPYFRNHAANDSKSNEPWAFGEDVLQISRNYIELRYKLLPYLYSAFHEAATTGMPLMRSLAIDYTHDAHVYQDRFQNQYLFGAAFLVAPFESTRDLGKVYFPGGKWYRLYDDAVETGAHEKAVDLSPATLPVYVKESSIVPMQSLVQSTMEAPSDTLTIHIYKGDIDNDSTYYEDDGVSFAYQQDQYYQRTMHYDAAHQSVSFGAAEGKLASKFRKLEIVLHGAGDAPAVKLNGVPLATQAASYAFIGAAPGQATAEHCPIRRAVIDNDSKRITISF